MGEKERQMTERVGFMGCVVSDAGAIRDVMNRVRKLHKKRRNDRERKSTGREKERGKDGKKRDNGTKRNGRSEIDK